MELANYIVSLLMFLATALLVGVTAWYSVLTFRILREIRRQGELIAVSAAVSVQAAVTSMPGPNEISQAHHDAFQRIKDLDRDIIKLPDRIRKDMSRDDH